MRTTGTGGPSVVSRNTEAGSNEAGVVKFLFWVKSSRRPFADRTVFVAPLVVPGTVSS